MSTLTKPGWCQRPRMMIQPRQIDRITPRALSLTRTRDKADLVKTQITGWGEVTGFDKDPENWWEGDVWHLRDWKYWGRWWNFTPSGKLVSAGFLTNVMKKLDLNLKTGEGFGFVTQSAEGEMYGIDYASEGNLTVKAEVVWKDWESMINRSKTGFFIHLSGETVAQAHGYWEGLKVYNSWNHVGTSNLATWEGFYLDPQGRKRSRS